MGKKKSWFTYVKTLFISEPKLKPEKKRKNSRPKFKHTSKRTLSNAEEDQREKHAVAVATAAAAAAEAAIAAAKAAAEVARLTNFSQELGRKSPHSAATKIQTCYKGYLARKALSALKGVVKLQAVVRGELARRSVIKKQTLLSLWQLRLHRSMIFEEKQNRATLGTTKLAQLKLRTAIEEAKKEDLIQRRRSFCSNKSRKDDTSSYKSTSFPAYMAPTESAKAKVKARQPLRLPGSYAWPDSPSKLSVSSWSSFKSEVIKPSKTNMSC